MKTFEQMVREEPSSFRYYVLFVLMGLGSLITSLTGMSKTAGTLIVVASFLSVNLFIWLRQNPTLKQIEKRKLREAAAMEPRQKPTPGQPDSH